ncbi:MAG: L-threonylcarbamoyladenylate synthase [Gemmatimonadales bacterium]
MILPFQTAAQVQVALPRALAHLTRNRVLGHPTETVYGLGSTLAESGIAAVAELKGRPLGKPFLLLVASPAMARERGLRFSHPAEALARAFWPGPLTLVLPSEPGLLPEAVRGADGGVAVRQTSHPGMTRLLEQWGAPLTSTSANRPGQPPASDALELVKEFGAAARSGTLLVLDGGVLGNPPPSTLVDCSGDGARLLREGAISRTGLRRVIGSLLE